MVRFVRAGKFSATLENCSSFPRGRKRTELTLAPVAEKVHLGVKISYFLRTALLNTAAYGVIGLQVMRKLASVSGVSLDDASTPCKNTEKSILAET
jgi:hypothetical protein